MFPSVRVAVLAAVLAITGALTATPANANAHATNTLTMRGADISSLQRSVDLGAKYYNAAGHAQNPLDILKSAGANYMRLRVWNNPVSGYNDKDSVLRQARSIKAKGLKLLIDFHYSDTWADPGKQFPPASWASHTLPQLQNDVYRYTYDVCRSLKAQGTTPDSVQIGNEINVGMLWPQGQVVNNDFAPLASLLKKGYQAVKDCNRGTQVLIHTADADNVANAHWFYDGIAAQGVKWDVTALSYYCFWHGTLANLSSVIGDVKARYGKPVVLAETAYPFTTLDADDEPNVISGPSLCDGIPSTPQGQAKEFGQVQDTARAAGAVGVFYWEPTWYAVAGNGWDPADIKGTGDGWDNMAIFDASGHVNPYVRWKP
jgi:arabinogalactan endo-1,4-beta-galactosidase